MGKKLNISLVALGLISLFVSGCANPFYKTPTEACGPPLEFGIITKEVGEKLEGENPKYLFIAGQPVDYVKCRDAHGDISATYVLGLFYLKGIGVEKDVTKAIALFAKTGPQPRKTGQYYSAPFGSWAGGMESFEISPAREGLPEARYQLGKIFVYGLNGEVDMELGLWHLEIASRQGYQKATDLLAQLPWDGVLDGKINGKLPLGKK